MAVEVSQAKGPYAAAWADYRKRERIVTFVGLCAAIGWLLIPVFVLWGIGEASPGEVLASAVLLSAVIALQGIFFILAWRCHEWRCPHCGNVWGEWPIRRVYECPMCRLQKYAASPSMEKEMS